VHTVAPGPWCAHIPVWCNPYLNLEVLTHAAVTQNLVALPCLERPWSSLPRRRPLRAMRDSRTNVAAPPYLPGVHTLGDLVRLHAAALAARGQPAPLHASLIYGPDTTVILPAAASEWISWILAVQPRLPQEWWHAAQVHVHDHPGFLAPFPWTEVLASDAVSAAVRSLLRGAGWFEPLLPHLPPAVRPPRRIPLGWHKSALTVPTGTRLQLAEPLAEQRCRRLQLVRDALAAALPASPALPPAMALFHAMCRGMHCVASCPWVPNHHLETFWRLGLNGVPYAGGYDQAPHAGGCSCGWLGPPPAMAPEPASRLWRSHVFGSCVVAQAVVAAVSACLALPAALPAPEAHFWLMHPPSAPLVHVGPWRVICLAAVTAMDFGRSCLHRLCHDPALAPPPSPGSPALVAGRRAVARFWDLLLEATASRPAAPSDWAGVGAAHPILSVDPVGGFVRCTPPA
jgi:hypothetical protein